MKRLQEYLICTDIFILPYYYYYYLKSTFSFKRQEQKNWDSVCRLISLGLPLKIALMISILVH